MYLVYRIPQLVRNFLMENLMKKMILLVLTALVITQTSFSAQSGRLFPKVCRFINVGIPISSGLTLLHQNKQTNQQTALLENVDETMRQLVLEQAKKMKFDISGLVIKRGNPQQINEVGVYGTSNVLVIPETWCDAISKQTPMSESHYELEKAVEGAVFQHALTHANENHILKKLLFGVTIFGLSNPTGKLLAQVSKSIAPKIFSTNSSASNISLFSRAVGGGCAKNAASMMALCSYARQQIHEADDGVVDKENLIKYISGTDKRQYDQFKQRYKKIGFNESLIKILYIAYYPIYPIPDTRIVELEKGIEKQKVLEQKQTTKPGTEQ